MANEKRLIDAERFNRILQNFEGNLLEAGKTEGAEAVKTIIKGLKTEPTVDAVEVVRCKDCKHRADELDCGNYLCNRKMIGMVRPNDFCSFGERE